MAVTSADETTSTPTLLRPAVALQVDEQWCEVYDGNRLLRVRFAPNFPRPRLERVSPGHVLAVASGPDDNEVALWRWYDAVVLGDDGEGHVRMWEPAHGVVSARRRDTSMTVVLGSRAYLSAGLPGADWWLAGPVVDDPRTADVELDEVARLYGENDLWPSVFGSPATP